MLDYPEIYRDILGAVVRRLFMKLEFFYKKRDDCIDFSDRFFLKMMDCNLLISYLTDLRNVESSELLQVNTYNYIVFNQYQILLVPFYTVE